MTVSPESVTTDLTNLERGCYVGTLDSDIPHIETLCISMAQEAFYLFLVSSLIQSTLHHFPQVLDSQIQLTRECSLQGVV